MILILAHLCVSWLIVHVFLEYMTITILLGKAKIFRELQQIYLRLHSALLLQAFILLS